VGSARLGTSGGPGGVAIPAPPGSLESARSSRRIALLAWCLPPVLVLVAWWPTLGGFFLGDDFWMLELARLGFDEIWTSRGGWSGQKHRPLTIASLVVDHHLWGTAALGYRVTNLVLHAAAALLAGRLARALSGSEKVALTAGSLFAIVPVHPQAVTWIAARADPLVALFSAIGALALLRYMRAPRVLDLFVMLAATWAACASKELGFVMPAAFGALVLGAATDGRSLRRGLVGVAATLLLAGVWFFVRAALLGTSGSPIGKQEEGLAGLLRLLSPGPLLSGLATGIRLLLAPTGLEVAESELLIALSWLPVALAVLALLVGTWQLARGRLAMPPRRTLRACASAVACAIVGILPLAAWAPMLRAPRMLYVSMMFGCVAMGLALGAMIESRSRLARAMGGTLLLVTSLSWGTLLMATQLPWIEAGRVTREVVESLPELPPQVTFVAAIDVPSERRGAMYLRMGLDHAAWRFAGWPRERRVLRVEPADRDAVLAKIRADRFPHVAALSWTGSAWRIDYLPGDSGPDGAGRDG
jgi:hypothetical protein